MQHIQLNHSIDLIVICVASVIRFLHLSVKPVRNYAYFETDADQSVQNPDYQAICWLVNPPVSELCQAAELIEGLVKSHESFY